MQIFGTAALIIASMTSPALSAQTAPTKTSVNVDLGASRSRLEGELVAKHGEGQRVRVQRGLKQAAAFWRTEDGTTADFEAFVRTHFAGDAKTLDGLFQRLEFALESLNGHMAEIGRDLRWHSDLDLGPMLPVDEIISGYDASAHFIDDAFANKLAFTVLLNFPMSTLDERLQQGEQWTRRQWAEARLVDLFAKRIPAEVNLAIADAAGQSDRYIASYNIWMHHLVNDKGQRLFEPKKRLLSHWNLRDELKSRYAEGKGGLERQRMIQKVMERIVTQTIPAAVIDSPFLDWNPYTNDVKAAAVKDSEAAAPADLKISNTPEPDTRYKVLLDCFKAVKKADPYSPKAPTHIARSFEEGRQIPEARVKKMLEDVCANPLLKEGNEKRIRVQAESLREAYIQGVLARGDRRLGQALLEAHKLGGRKQWKQALKLTGIDEKEYLNREYSRDEALPWHRIDVGVSVDYLWAELQKARQEAATVACSPECGRCGVCEVQGGLGTN